MRKVAFFALPIADFLLRAGSAWASGEGEHGEAGSIMPLIWHILNFTILAVALYYLFAKKIAAFFAERKEHIEGAILEAQRTRQEVEKRVQECEVKLQGVDREVVQLREEAERDMEKLRQKLQEEAQQAEQKINRQARLNIEREAKKATNDLQAEAALLAISLAEEVLKKNINLEDQQRLFREYLANIGDSNWAGRS